MSRVAVIGAGAWGTTLAILLAENGHEVVLWAFETDLASELNQLRENKRFLPGFPLPPSITATNRVEDIRPADLALFVVPTQFLRQTARRFRGAIDAGVTLVAAGKGIEEGTLKLPLQILAEELGTNAAAVLSGPNLSQEIARGLPAAAVAAANNEAVASRVQSALMQERFRVYRNDDPIGVQLGGALKNVIAIAAGVIDGLELGDNAKAGLLIRGIVEITRLGVALGARAETFAGLSGMGDLITTCGSRLSRNHTVGEQIARGRSLKEILAGMKEVAEGVPTTIAARELGRKHRISLPITEQVYQVLYETKDPYRAINELMTRSATSE
ncbi:MAG: NAD(P)-dependent glycerol-3-phosphate dehydrogenase [Candidatus Margulisbacteria bacterium]|nr:NAD(P)-dependent glycerol-3-phosphate dehydrogenase [Candidatus Margulisiibacteriota bacterium]